MFPSSPIINFELDFEKDASLSIYNNNGQEIKHVYLGIEKTGNYKLNCSEFSSGIYFITLETDSEVLTEKLIIE